MSFYTIFSVYEKIQKYISKLSLELGENSQILVLSTKWIYRKMRIYNNELSTISSEYAKFRTAKHMNNSKITSRVRKVVVYSRTKNSLKILHNELFTISSIYEKQQKQETHEQFQSYLWSWERIQISWY